MDLALGLFFALVYGVSFRPLLRLIRSDDRPGWLRKPLHVEYVLLAHMALLLLAVALIAKSLLES